MIRLTAKQKNSLLGIVGACSTDIPFQVARAIAERLDREIVAYDAAAETEGVVENLTKFRDILEEFFNSLNMGGKNGIDKFIDDVVKRAEPVMKTHDNGTSIWERMQNVPSLRNKQMNDESHPYESHHDKSGNDLITPLKPEPTIRRKTTPMPIPKLPTASSLTSAIVKLADRADDIGMHSHADALTRFAPLVRIAQYEGFQQYCIQNGRAFQKSVREKLENGSMHDAWWETLDEYQKSIAGESEDFLSKYAGVPSSEDDREVAKLFVEIVNAKIAQKIHPGVAAMEAFEEIGNGEALFVEAARIDQLVGEVDEKMLKEAGILDSIKNWWGQGGNANPAALAKRITSLWKQYSQALIGLMSQHPQAQEEPAVQQTAQPVLPTPATAAASNKHIKVAADPAAATPPAAQAPAAPAPAAAVATPTQAPAPAPAAAGPTRIHYNDFLNNGGNALLSPMLQFTSLMKKLAPNIPTPTLPNLNDWAKTGWLPKDKYHDILLQMKRLVMLASDSGTVRDLEMASKNPAAVPQREQPTTPGAENAAPQADAPQPQAPQTPQAPSTAVNAPAGQEQAAVTQAVQGKLQELRGIFDAIPAIDHAGRAKAVAEWLDKECPKAAPANVANPAAAGKKPLSRRQPPPTV